MEVALIGLGKMGASMGHRLIAAGHTAFGHDRKEEKRRAFGERGGQVLDSLEEVSGRLSPRRVVWLMIPAGPPVDEVLKALQPRLSAGDIVVDGGNSHYRDTIRRAKRLREDGVSYVDAGTSGGVWGRQQGYCLMVGGEEEAVEHIRPLLEALAPAKDRGWGRVGGPGSGHFVKMVHNGIEYGMMQAYTEGFALLEKKEEFRLDLVQVAGIWRHGSVIRSWLLDLAARALKEEPDLETVEPWVDDSGEGRWAVSEAIDLDSPAPVMTLALLERLSSRDRDRFAHRLLAALRAGFGGHAVRRRGD